MTSEPADDVGLGIPSSPLRILSEPRSLDDAEPTAPATTAIAAEFPTSLEREFSAELGEPESRAPARSIGPSAARSEDSHDPRGESEVPEASAVGVTLEAVRRGIDPVLGLSLVVGAGTVLLIIGSQTASLLESLARLPTIPRWIGYALSAMVMISVSIALGRLAILYARLRLSPRLAIAALERLRERHETRRLAMVEYRQARERLLSFLHEFPLDDAARRRLNSIGFDRERLERLDAERRRLCDQRAGADDAWIRAVDQRFLSLLDEAANGRIRHHALRVSLKTAALPTGFLDAAAVASHGFQLVADLCRIYNLRAGRWDTCVIFGQLVVNAFVASRAEEALDPFLDDAGDHVAEELGGALAGTVGGAATRIVGRRAAEAAINGMLLRRLGRATLRSLRPIDPR